MANQIGILGRHLDKSKRFSFVEGYAFLEWSAVCKVLVEVNRTAWCLFCWIVKVLEQRMKYGDLSRK